MSERFYEEYGTEESKQDSGQNYNYGNQYGHPNTDSQNSDPFANRGYDQNGYNQGYDRNGYNRGGFDPNNYGRPQPPKREPLAIASLVLGVVGLFLALLSCCCSPYFGIVVVIVNMAGIVTGILSKKGKRMEGVAIAGIIMSIFGMLIALFFVAIYAFVLNSPEFIAEIEAIYESMGIDLEALENQL